jgi:hypothetical protein
LVVGVVAVGLVVVVVVEEAGAVVVVVAVGAVVVVVTGAVVPLIAWRRATSVAEDTLGRVLPDGPNPTVTSCALRSLRDAGFDV